MCKNRRLLALLIPILAVGLLSGCASSPKENPAIPGQQESVEKLMHQANTAYDSGNDRDAIFYYQRVLSISPNDRQALIKSGQLYLNNGIPEQAENSFEKVLNDNPSDIDALEGVAISQLKLRRFAEAKGNFEKVISLNDKRWNAWNGLGVLADIENDFTRSVECYQNGLQVLPNNPIILNNLGYSLIMAHRYHEAEKVLRSAISHTPMFNNRLKNNLALALAWQGDYQNALLIISGIYSEAIAYNNIGYIALLNKDYETAIEYFELSMIKSPSYYERASENLAKASKLRDLTSK